MQTNRLYQSLGPNREDIPGRFGNVNERGIHQSMVSRRLILVVEHIPSTSPRNWIKALGTNGLPKKKSPLNAPSHHRRYLFGCPGKVWLQKRRPQVFLKRGFHFFFCFRGLVTLIILYYSLFTLKFVG